MAKEKESGSEIGSGEVTNGFWSCRDISDIVPLYTPRSLYLKPIAKVNVSVSLPQLKTPGKTISTWDVMEKIRHLIRPDEFGSLKVVKNTLEFIRLEGDVRDRSRLSQVLARLDSQCLKLEGFLSTLKVRAVETKDDFPTRHSWDSYFRDAKHMNELKAGERPDTIYVTGLPIKWFSEGDSKTPSEALVKKIFSKWGTLRRVDVPAADPYRSRMRLGQNIQKFSFEDGLFFEAYVQYIEYMDFVRAMDALRGMKLLKKEDKNYLTAAIKVDFDKTKHMSDNSVSHRAFERKRLIAQDNLAAEKLRKREELENKRKEELKKKEAADVVAKDLRRKQREEKRKRNALTVFRKQEEDKVSMKIAREERKLIKAQRQLESIRLLDELFDRIKIKIEKKEISIAARKDEQKSNIEKDPNKSADEKNDVKKEKKGSKKKKKRKRKKNKKDKGSNSSSSDDSAEETQKKKLKSVSVKNAQNPELTDSAAIPYPAMYPRFGPQPWYYDAALPIIYPPSGRGFKRGRGMRGRNRHNWHNDGGRSANTLNSSFFYNKQYYKYFASLAGQDYHTFDDYDRDSRSESLRLSKSRSRSHTPSRRNKRNKYRSKSSSRNRSKSRSRNRSKSRSRNRSESRSRNRSKNRSRSRSRRRSYNRSNSLRRWSRSRTKSKAKSRSRSRSSHSKSRKSRSDRSKSKQRSKSRSRSRSRNGRSSSKVKITRAKSKSPANRKSSSSSWSLPKTPEKRRSCSWSKSADEKV